MKQLCWRHDTFPSNLKLHPPIQGQPKMILQMRNLDFWPSVVIIMYWNGQYISQCPAAVGGRSPFRPTPSSCYRPHIAKSTNHKAHITLHKAQITKQSHRIAQSTPYGTLQTAPHTTHGKMQSSQKHSSICTDFTAYCSNYVLWMPINAQSTTILTPDLRSADIMGLQLADGSHIQCHCLGLNELLLPAS